MSAKLTRAANITCLHERIHSLAAVAAVAGIGAAGRAVIADMGFRFGVVGEVGASIAGCHMRQVQATDIPHSVAAAEDSRLVAAQMAPVLARGLVRQPLSVTQEAWY